MKKKKFQKPTVRFVDFEIQNVICASAVSSGSVFSPTQNESYSEIVNTASTWFN